MSAVWRDPHEPTQAARASGADVDRRCPMRFRFWRRRRPAARRTITFTAPPGGRFVYAAPDPSIDFRNQGLLSREEAGRRSRASNARRLGAALYLYLGVPLVAVAMVLLAWGGGR